MTSAATSVDVLMNERERLLGFRSGAMMVVGLCLVGVPSLLNARAGVGDGYSWAVAAITLLPAAYLVLHDVRRLLRIRSLTRAVRRMDPTVLLSALLLLVAAVLPGHARAQTFQGRVLDEENDAPVSVALVRLLDVEGKDVGFALADSAGRYRVETPGPGSYRLVAERLGYAANDTPLLAVENPEGVYPVDVELRRVPLPISGVMVSVERQREVERAIRLVAGTNPRSLRTPPIPRRIIEEHLAKAHSLPDMVRWSNAPIVVKGRGRDTCFEHRGACMRVFLNGVPLDPDFWDVLPLDMLETVVIVGRNESIIYGSSILLYTAGWLR